MRLESGQIYLEEAPFLNLAFNLDKTAALFDDPIDCGQSEAGSFSRGFSGEKGLKDVSKHCLVHSNAAIAHCQQNIVAGFAIPGQYAIRRVKLDIGCCDGQHTPVRHGIAGVYSKIDEDLADLRTIESDIP